MKKVNSATLQTIEAKCVEVEASFTNGLPSFTIVGLASNIIQEAKDSVNFQSKLYYIKLNCINKCQAGIKLVTYILSKYNF
ncbi:hypothetical protein OZZ08_03870 [Malaciobacter mytili]|uniref:hypothetical protein n=1 Tax=Malaciobacter mytili TaxID=603050 RepID=UPI003BB106C3